MERASGWTQNMFRKSQLQKIAGAAGGIVEQKDGHLYVHGIRGVVGGGRTGLCSLRKSLGQDGQQAGGLEGATHAIALHTGARGDGWVYEADGTAIGNQLGEMEGGWKTISMGRTDGVAESAEELLARYARRIVGAARALEVRAVKDGRKKVGEVAAESYRIRANIGVVEGKIEGMTIGIVGLGGTGAYILDLISKTAVGRVILVDGDQMEIRNTMRSPGGITEERVKQMQEERVRKVEYYKERYKEFPVEIDCIGLMADERTGVELRNRGATFAFVAIDQAGGGVRGRQDSVYEGLTAVGIAFIDCGISLELKDGALRGAISTTYCAAGESTWKREVPNAGIYGAWEGYHNVQVPETNVIAAGLAVARWRRETGQYHRDGERTRVSRYRIEEDAIRKGGT